ncbi:MAG: hypothetical protein Q4Q23_07360 [Methanobacteriaceae archaeon]|nr:hypothetical protein [Methanobacteriaceae archaeon]
MNIITTPMCYQILDIAGIKNYSIVKPSKLCDADIAITLQETKTKIPTIKLKLNTYTQILESIDKLVKYFDTNKNLVIINQIINENNKLHTNNTNRKNIKVKVYTNFLKDIAEDLGYTIVDKGYDYVIYPDYLKEEINKYNTLVEIPSHKNTSKKPLERIKARYEIMEDKIPCMKQ